MWNKAENMAHWPVSTFNNTDNELIGYWCEFIDSPTKPDFVHKLASLFNQIDVTFELMCSSFYNKGHILFLSPSIKRFYNNK